MKTEDEIAREKEAVQKMIGAKSAMEAALGRIDRLEKALSSVNIILAEVQKTVGDGFYTKTYHHGIGRGVSDGAQVILLKDQVGYVRRIIDAVM